MLEIFKKDKSFLTRSKEIYKFVYKIDFDEHGAFLDVCDTKLNTIKNIDFRVHNGLDREILQLIEEKRKDNFFEISWEGDSDKLYLDKNLNLIELLRGSSKLLLNDGTTLDFLSDTYNVNLNISKEAKYQLIVTINNSNDFKLISDSYVISNQKLIKIYPIGNNYQELINLNTSVELDKLEELLTIMWTHFNHINVNFENYKIVHIDEPKIIKPAVIFEKITTEKKLVLKTSATFASLGPQFFNDFNITKIVIINELEKSIHVYDCDFSDVFEIYDTIYRKLTSLKKEFDSSSFSEEDGLFIVDESIANAFILRHLQSIISKCELYGSDKLKDFNYSTSAPSLNISFKDKIDYLETNDVSVTIGQDTFSIFNLINLYKKHAYIPLSNGEKSIVDKSYITKLERIFKKEGEKVTVSFFDLPEIEELISKKDQKVFKDSRAFYDGFNKIKKSRSKIPKLDGVTLRDYQKEGARWLQYLYDNNFGGCLADDMGLGKTVQAITLFSYIYPKCSTPSLIVMPKSLLINWQNELKKFNPNLSFYLYYGNLRELSNIGDYNLILTTYSIVRNDIEKLKNLEFDTILLDESQNIKNITSKISKSVMLLKAKHKFTLSGTPIENSLMELYALFRFINEGIFSTIANFKKDFAVPIQSEGNYEVAKLLRTKITPFLLRRVKSEVLKDLPAKQEQVIYIDMSKEHKKFYDEKRDYYKKLLKQQISLSSIASSQFIILQAFNDLRQIASAPELKSDNTIVSSKIDALFEMLEDIILNGHKVLLFANFLGSLDLISQKADELGYNHLLMTGSTRNRQELVDKFQNDKDIKLFLMTLKVGGVGLNLTEADYVFIFDPWWNKSAENQAVDRAHRMGQKNRVFSYKMITKDTIEEKILELQMQKQDVTDMIVSTEDSGLKQLSASDLEYILG